MTSKPFRLAQPIEVGDRLFSICPPAPPKPIPPVDAGKVTFSVLGDAVSNGSPNLADLLAIPLTSANPWVPTNDNPETLNGDSNG